MKKIYIAWIVVLLSKGFLSPVLGQQTPVFANYNYNTVVINPAHAGFYPNSDITLTNRGYLTQVEGSPRNIGLTVNTPLRSKNMGLGAGVYSDQVGVTTIPVYLRHILIKYFLIIIIIEQDGGLIILMFYPLE